MTSDVPPIPVFDPAAIDLIRNTAGERGGAFVVEVAQLFLDETTRSMEELRAASLRSDWGTVRRISHSVKSSAATVGLMQLANACRALELDTKKGTSGPGTPALVSAVLEQFESAIPVIEGLR